MRTRHALRIMGILAALAGGTSTTMGQTYSSSGPAIVVPSTGQSLPYPSQITVSDGPTDISRISVRLEGLSHTWPADLDVLLVAPSGRQIVLMSDVGGGADVTNISLTFADGFPAITGTLATGFYSCTNTDALDVWPSPAPAGTRSASLAGVLGESANGNWRLFIVDDSQSDTGVLQSWSISFNDAADRPPEPLAATMTYQGRLDSGGSPLTGLADVQYDVWTSPVNSTESYRIGTTQLASDVEVSNGLFTVRGAN